MGRLATAVLVFVSLVAFAAGERGNAVLIRAINGLTVEGAVDWDSVYSAGVFDFSGLERADRINGRYFGRGDSIVMELMPDCRIDFATASLGGYKIVCLEGRTWRADIDSLPVDGHSARNDSVAMSMDLSSHFEITGVSRQTTYSGYTLIIEAGDTLRNARLLRIDFHGNARALYGDSLSSALSLTRCYWFAADSKWPVAVASHIDLNTVGEFQAVYLFPESMQNLAREKREDYQTASPYYNVSYATADNLTVARHSAYTPNAMRNYGSNLNDGLSADDIQISISGNQLIVGIVDSIGVADIVLCDVLGRTIPLTTTTDNQLIFNQLPTGDYILSYTINGDRRSHKFYIPPTR